MEVPADCEAAAWLRHRFTTWLLVLPYLFMNYGLSLLIVDGKASLFMWPSYTKRGKTLLAIPMVILAGSWVYSIFLPLKPGMAWFYAGLPIYLLGLVFVTMAVLAFATTPVGKPNTTGIYCVSRHPMNFGWFLIFRSRKHRCKAPNCPQVETPYKGLNQCRRRRPERRDRRVLPCQE